MAKRVPLSTVMLEIAAKAIWLVLHFYILNFTFLAEIAKRSSSERVLPIIVEHVRLLDSAGLLPHKRNCAVPQVGGGEQALQRVADHELALAVVRDMYVCGG